MNFWPKNMGGLEIIELVKWVKATQNDDAFENSPLRQSKPVFVYKYNPH